MNATIAAVIVAMLLAAARAPAQILEDLRNALRESLSSDRYASFIAALTDLTDDTELSAAKITVGGDPELELSTFKIPYRTTFELPDWSPDLYVEANLGYLRGRMQVPDLFAGADPRLATHVDSSWTAISGLGGVGLEFPVADGLDLTPIANVSLSYVRNETYYAGAGAELTQAIADGILFNYDATLLTYGGALRATYERPITDELRVEAVARYDLRQTIGLSETDEAQDPSALTQRLTVRVDTIGQTGLDVFDHEVDWRADAAYTRFLGETGRQLGFDGYFELGFGLETRLDGSLGPLSELSLSGSILLGEDLSGWSLGLGVAF